MTGRLFIAAAFLFPAFLLHGCLAEGPDADLSPLLRRADHRATGEKETEMLVPFIASKESSSRDEWAFRPLVGFEKDKEKGVTSFDFIPPLGRYFSRGARSRFRFWPLYSYTKVTRKEGEDVDWILFPLLFGGHSASGENYFALFPLGGRIRNFISYDSFDFVLWPLYQRVTKKCPGPPRVSTSFLLLFGWTTGGRMDGSFHVLPFYMKSVWKGKYRKYSVLWPFFHFQEKGLDTKHPAAAYGFWPLFHLEGADNYYRYGFIGPLLFMGPLVQASREVPDTWQGRKNDEGNAYYLYDLPWPLLRWEKTRKHDYFRFFPFYSHYHQERSGTSFDSKAFLIPFIWSRRSRTRTYAKSDFFFVPLVTSIRKTYAQGGGKDSYFQLWPLFHTESTAKGGAAFSFLSPMPSRLAKPLESVERLFWPFWTLYRYERDPSGARRYDFLFTLVSSYADDTETRFSIPLLYRYLNREGSGWEHDFLWKLLTISGDAGGLKSLKLLFIPIVSTSERKLYPGRASPAAGS